MVNINKLLLKSEKGDFSWGEAFFPGVTGVRSTSAPQKICKKLLVFFEVWGLRGLCCQDTWIFLPFQENRGGVHNLFASICQKSTLPGVVISHFGKRDPLSYQWSHFSILEVPPHWVLTSLTLVAKRPSVLGFALKSGSH